MLHVCSVNLLFKFDCLNTWPKANEYVYTRYTVFANEFAENCLQTAIWKLVLIFERKHDFLTKA